MPRASRSSTSRELSVRQRQLPAFRDEQARFALRFTCEHCTYFRAVDQRCSHGYPNAEHRSAHYAHSENVLLFCKDFELM